MSNTPYILAGAALVGLVALRRSKPSGNPANADNDPEGGKSTPDLPMGAKSTDYDAQARAALAAIATADKSKAIARLVEKVYRLETGNFTSELFKRTNAAGQKALKPDYPFGWPRRGTVASDYGPVVNMVDTGEGVASNWVNYKELPVAMGVLAQFIRDHGGNAARWNSTDAARQAAYTAKLQKIPTPLTDSI